MFKFFNIRSKNELKNQILILTAANESLKAENKSLDGELKTQKKRLEVEIRDHQAVMDQVGKKLKEYETTIKSMEGSADIAAHNAKYKLIMRINELGEMSLEQLRAQKCDFDVYPSSDIHNESEFDFDDEDVNAEASDPDAAKPDKWAVVTSYCQYGGCDIRTWFDDERSARIYAILRTENGFPAGSTLCGSCRQEYYANME